MIAGVFSCAYKTSQIGEEYLAFQTAGILVHTAPPFALWTAAVMNALPSTPSSTVGKSNPSGIG